jgi:hypothetical protein
MNSKKTTNNKIIEHQGERNHQMSESDQRRGVVKIWHTEGRRATHEVEQSRSTTEGEKSRKGGPAHGGAKLTHVAVEHRPTEGRRKYPRRSEEKPTEGLDRPTRGGEHP